MKFLLDPKIRSLVIILLLVAGTVFAQDFPPVPNPPRLVNDFTNTLSNAEKQQLENKLVA